MTTDQSTTTPDLDETEASPAGDEPLSELLVEEVSIDGMCGVY